MITSLLYSPTLALYTWSDFLPNLKLPNLNWYIHFFFTELTYLNTPDPSEILYIQSKSFDKKEANDRLDYFIPLITKGSNIFGSCLYYLTKNDLY